MNPKLKKIIAREGIIVLLTILAGCIILITVRYIGRNHLFFLSKIRYNANVRPRCWIEPQYLTRDFRYKFELLGIVLIFCYPTYILTKFIIWAIKALRENKVRGKPAIMSQKVGKEDKKTNG